MKICSRKKCSFNGQPQPFGNFYNSFIRKDGLCPECKTCRKEQDQDRYFRKKPEIRAKQNKYERERRQADPDFKIRKNLRRRLGRALEECWKTGSAVTDLGCSIPDFKKWLEEQFYINPETGEQMTWNNYGRNGWNIDHIIPLCAFDLSDREQFLKAVHYTNLRPMWAKQNFSEGARGFGRKSGSKPKELEENVQSKTENI